MKFKKIIFINFIFLLCIFVLFELTGCIFLSYKYKEEISAYLKIATGKETKLPIIKYNKVTEFSDKMLALLRPAEYGASDKPPVILFGCSYTEGFGLQENETFSKVLSEYTGRTVYNRGLSGTGIPFMYYQLSEPKISKDFPDNTEYVIFTLIPDHFPRLFRYRNFVLSGDHTLRYKLVDGKLVRDKLKFPFIHSLYTSIIIEEYIALKNSFDEKKTNKLSYSLIKESYYLIKQKMPTAKFVILYYSAPNDPDNFQNDKLELIQSISKDIKIIKVKDICPEIYSGDMSYWLTDNEHPSAKAWKIIVPRLSEVLNLKQNY